MKDKEEIKILNNPLFQEAPLQAQSRGSNKESDLATGRPSGLIWFLVLIADIKISGYNIGRPSGQARWGGPHWPGKGNENWTRWYWQWFDDIDDVWEDRGDDNDLDEDTNPNILQASFEARHEMAATMERKESLQESSSTSQVRIWPSLKSQAEISDFDILQSSTSSHLFSIHRHHHSSFLFSWLRQRAWVQSSWHW